MSNQPNLIFLPRRTFPRGLRDLLAAVFLIVIASAVHHRGVAAPTDPRALAPPATDALGDPLPAGALVRLGTTRFHAPSSNYDMTLSPDEKTVVTVGHQLMVWDTKTGKELWRFDPNEHGLSLSAASYGTRAVAFTADSQYFYTPRGRNGVTRWNVATGEKQALSIIGNRLAIAEFLQGSRDQASKAIDLSPDGKTLVIGNALGVIACDVEGNVLFQIVNEDRAANRFNGNDRLMFGGAYSLVRYSPDGKLLAAVLSQSPNEIRLLNSQTDKELRRIALKAKLVRLAFSPDSKQIAATERDNAVRLYAVDTGKEIWSHIVPLKNRGENYTSAIAYSPNGKLLAVGATDSHIHLLDAATGNETGDLSAELWYPWALAFTADSTMLYSTGWDGGVSRWDVAARKLLPLPAGIRATSVCAASPDAQNLAFEDKLGSIRMVNAAECAEITIN
jgi:WD40 repeat protein